MAVFMKNIRHTPFVRKKILLILYVFFLVYTNPIEVFAADSEHYSEETLISLDFENKSLKQVLKEISWATGYSFTINKEYSDLKISGSLNKVPLHQGLKEILGKHSHTITYEPNKTVSLSIYKSSPPAPFITDVTNLSVPSNYTTISPQDMEDQLGAEIPFIEAENSPEETELKWEDDYDEIDSQADINEDAYYGEEFKRFPPPLVSQKKGARIKLKGTDLDSFDRYNEYQDYYEKDVENEEE